VRYRVEVRPAAARQLAKLDRASQRRVIAAMELLRERPRPSGAERMQGDWKGFLRVRSGSFRIIYFVQDEKLVVCVVKIGHRRDVYRRP